MHTTCLATLEWAEIQRMVRQRTATPLGAAEAGELIPRADPEGVVEERRLTVEALELLGEGERLPFLSLQELSPHLQRLDLDGVRLEGQELYDLCLLLSNGEEIRTFVARQEGRGRESPRLEALAGELPDLGDLLRSVGAHLSSSGQVLDSASADLRKIRRRLSHLSDKLTRELQAIIDRSDSSIFLRDEYITVRNGRFVLPIRTDSPIPVPGILHGRSSTGLTHFVEPMTTVAINNEIVGLREAEEEELDRILRDYTRRFQNARDPVRATASLVARFDVIQARARLAADMRAIPAAEGDLLSLDDARHPILEESLTAVGERPVPISVELGGNHPILIISGPNTGGKTVALKTVGLLVLMNQAGLLLPAAGARLPVFRQVLVDIGDHQSIAANLSTFSAHMKNIAWMTGQVEPPTLVLLDEIGTGTDPEEGAALGVAILEHFRREGALVAVTTHMSGIKSHGYSAEGVKNACVEFDQETLRPTFRLLLGVAGSSSGIEIARRLGLPGELVGDARERLGPAGQQVDAYLRRVKETLDEAARERRDLAGQVREAERERSRWEEKARRQEKERARIFREELAAAVERYDAALKEQLRAVQDKALRRKLEHEGRRRGDRVRGAIDQEAAQRFQGEERPRFTPPTEVAPGDRVRIASLGQSGVVEEAASGDRVRVEVAGKTVTVPLADLMLLERADARQATRSRPAARVTFESGSREPLRRELNLVGCTVDEALPRLDKFLDEAFLAEYGEVRLVHGHGTGTLRRAIAEFLKTHPHVVNYRLADDRAGGTGVTVVELRR
jgi:DNA mismatch repair protein MutS2